MAVPKRHPTTQRVRDLRAALGMSQTEYARLLACSVRTLADVEQGRREPSEAAIRQQTQIARLCKAAKRVMAPAAVAAWILAPNPAFSGLKPVELIERGEIDKLWRALYAAESGEPV